MARPKRKGAFSLKQVLEQLQKNSNSGEEFDLEEKENAKRSIKTDPVVQHIDVLVVRLSWSAVCAQLGKLVCECAAARQLGTA